MNRRRVASIGESPNLDIEFELLYHSTSLIGDVLIIRVCGQYRDGSQGDMDAKFIINSMLRASKSWPSKSFLLDLSKLTYSFGDYFDSIYASPVKGKPIVIIPGAKCIEGMASLEGIPVDEFIDNKEFFSDESTALEYLKKEKTTTNNT